MAAPVQATLSSILLRFWFAMICGSAAGWLVYQRQILNPLSPAFKILTVGAAFAGILAMWRCRARAHGLALAVGYALFCLGFVSAYGWVSALSGTIVAGGLICTSIVYDELAPKLPFGKFLIIGPMVGILLAAVTPMVEYRNLIPLASGDAIVAYARLGWVLGVGISFGMEISDRMLRPHETAAQTVV